MITSAVKSNYPLRLQLPRPPGLCINSRRRPSCSAFVVLMAPLANLVGWCCLAKLRYKAATAAAAALEGDKGEDDEEEEEEEDNDNRTRYRVVPPRSLMVPTSGEHGNPHGLALVYHPSEARTTKRLKVFPGS